jgi:hypothetical protein
MEGRSGGLGENKKENLVGKSKLVIIPIWAVTKSV